MRLHHHLTRNLTPTFLTHVPTDDKRLFYALATRQLEGIDIDKYDPVHDISIPAIRPVNGNSVYSDPWRVQTMQPGLMMNDNPNIIGNSLFNSSNSDMETWSWKGRPIVKMKSTGVSTLPLEEV